ncbi:IS256 family transposase [Nocardiopsis metallicus]|uniref:Mutator family transposase n=1 Tax=Nocardiopsis metallicus TaxID=179819 RepID=A0A840WE21_9ACTN|nr:IS256 family transposase [Nocardiopsis metallicus]MBB5490205.1 transposase-like protein [Nocardiopsis metallicus]MBB5490364.1 transposase-like protein [Nocardiopsis metallicus]MBB5494881.1 transposase-like protein [Nocardiopsis metallicus]
MSDKTQVKADTGRSDEEFVQELKTKAEAEGIELVGENGLLARLTKTALENVLAAEMDTHLGYAKHERSTEPGGNTRNGTRSKTLTTEAGPVELDVPRDRDGSFEPQIVRKRQRRLNGVNGIVLSLSARGLTHGEICAHLAEVYDANVSKQTISNITEAAMERMAEWQNRPLDQVYPVLFVDAINVKIRDGQVANRPIYVVLGVTAEGERDILGLWAGDGNEGAKYWAHVFTELKNRGVADVLMLVADGIKGMSEAVESVWPRTVVQTCIVHLLRNSFRYASRADWEKVAKALKPVYTAATEEAALERFSEFCSEWGDKYPAIVRLWENAWAEMVPFLAFDVEIRKIICTTNAIESINARIRRAVKARGHFPNEQAALKCVYMALMALDPKGTGRAKWSARWKKALNAFDLTFDGRLTATRR